MNTSTQNVTAPMFYSPGIGTAQAEPLTDLHKQETLDFLARRPIDNVILSGWILDSGMVNETHRGTMFGRRDANGNLAGVALIGRHLLFDAATDEATASLAARARECQGVRMIFAEQQKLTKFWHHYRGESPMPNVSSQRSIRFSGKVPDGIDLIDDLRIATREDLDKIVSAHADMVRGETGVDPLVTDADGFRMRCAQRVDKGRVWVWTKDGELVFKTDIVSETPSAVYIEGLWVDPRERGKGYGARCLATMCQRLMTESVTICGFFDAERFPCGSFYRKAGFKIFDDYTRVYV